MKRTLFLMLLAASAGAPAQTPAPTASPAAAPGAVACDTPVYQVEPEALASARQALDKASAAPGAGQLELAAALADLAYVTVRQSAPQAQRDANRKATLDMIERAQAIWTAAPASADLAQDLLRRGRTARGASHCPLALNLLETALAVADKAKGATDPLPLSVARELMLLATNMGDDPTVNALAPRLLAALPTDQAPLDGIPYAAYLAAADYYYRSEDHERVEVLVNGLAERARATPAGRARLPRLDAERASIYYAQGRYKEAEALRPPPAHPERQPDPLLAEVKRAEMDMILAVRGGRLQNALALGEAALARIDAGRAANATELESAQAQWETEKRNGAREALAAARTRLAQARREAAIWQQALADMQGYTGEVQHALGRLDAALPLYEQALRNYPSAGAANVYAIERVRGDMALVYRARGEHARALALQQQVRDTLLPLLGARHPDVREAESEIAALKVSSPRRQGR